MPSVPCIPRTHCLHVRLSHGCRPENSSTTMSVLLGERQSIGTVHLRKRLKAVSGDDVMIDGRGWWHIMILRKQLNKDVGMEQGTHMTRWNSVNGGFRYRFVHPLRVSNHPESIPCSRASSLTHDVQQKTDEQANHQHQQKPEQQNT